MDKREYYYGILKLFFDKKNASMNENLSLSVQLCINYYKAVEKEKTVKQKYLDMLETVDNYLIESSNRKYYMDAYAHLQKIYDELIEKIKLQEEYSIEKNIENNSTDERVPLAERPIEQLLTIVEEPKDEPDSNLSREPENEDFLGDRYDEYIRMIQTYKSEKEYHKFDSEVDFINQFYYLVSNGFITDSEEFLIEKGFIPVDGRLLISSEVADSLLKNHGLNIFNLSDDEINQCIVNINDVPKVYIDEANFLLFKDKLIDAYKLMEIIDKKYKILPEKDSRSTFPPRKPKANERARRGYNKRKGKNRK